MSDKQPLLPTAPYPESEAEIAAWRRAEARRTNDKYRTLAAIAVVVLFGAGFIRPWRWHGWHHGPIVITDETRLDDSDWNSYEYSLATEEPVDKEWSCEPLEFEKDTNSSFLDFSVTAQAKAIKLWSRGLLFGNITLKSGGTSGDDVEVDLLFQKPDWYDEESKSKVKICTSQSPEDNIHSLGVIVPRCREHHLRDPSPTSTPSHPIPPKWPRPQDRFINVTATVRFPSNGENTLKIREFSSGLALLKHYLGDLNVAFEKLDIVGDSIEVNGASAASLSSVAIFGDISGNFSASRGLKLVSSQGSVDANVELFNDWEERFPQPPTELSVVASHGLVHTNVSLLTYREDIAEHPPSYITKITSSLPASGHGATSASSNTTLNFLAQPSSSILRVEVVSTGHPSLVKLAPEFEGTFELTTIKSEPEVIVNEETKDPSGEGRRRVVQISKQRWLPWFLRGSVHWEEQNTESISESGVVKLVTTGAPATLVLG